MLLQKKKIIGAIVVFVAVYNIVYVININTRHQQRQQDLLKVYTVQQRIPLKTSPDDQGRDTWEEKESLAGISNNSLPTDTDRRQEDITWTPYMDVLDENIAMKDAPLVDMRELADVTKSTNRIVNPKEFYEIGNEVKLFIQLYDGFGKPRTVGGDRLLVRIFENKVRQAKACGYILDHDNGTYTAIVTCLWSGNPSIQIALEFPRQVIRVFYHQHRTNYRTINGIYTNHEVQPCQPILELLNSSKLVCDMSYRNGGMSWWCQAPEAPGITCDDLLIFNTAVTFTKPITIMPDAKLKNFARTFFPPVAIVVKEGQMTNQIDSKPPCSSYNRTKLWFLPSPVGYFSHGQWKIRHCKAPAAETLPGCVRNKRFILFGDSTMRQWGEVFGRMFNAELTTEMPIIDGTVTKSDESRYNKELNLTIETIMHSFPGNKVRNVSQSIPQYMLRYMGKKNVVFVIHIFLHIITHHHSIWRERLRHIRRSIEQILQHNPDAKILIKGGNGVYWMRLLHYAHYVYRCVLLEEFKGLYERVVYLDVADATTASGIANVHPGDKHVAGMVEQMLAYVCD